ncbi:hypothetical protein DXG01_014364, partial [Tephrocybe rancida]
DRDCAMPPHDNQIDPSRQATDTGDEVLSSSDSSDAFSNEAFDEPHRGSDGDTNSSGGSDSDSGGDIDRPRRRARYEILEEESELWGAGWNSADGALPDYGWAGYALHHYPDDDTLQLVTDAAAMGGAGGAGSGVGPSSVG